ncbi:MAG: DapH/DapD/GlmU-related protein [Suipraeoptans sp.]
MKQLILRLMYPDSYSSERFIRTLRDKYHVDVGVHCKFWAPHKTNIDVQRPHMLHIGDYTKITEGVTVLCHDFSRGVLANICGGGEYTNIGEARYTYIGDNVFIGRNAIILMGTHIGDDSIVGAGAVVSGEYPNGMVIAGNPARGICTIEEFYQKRKSEEIVAAKLYVAKWREKYGKDPNIYDMTNAFAWLYLPHTPEVVEKYKKLFSLSAMNKEVFFQNFYATKPAFDSFEQFLEECNR